MFIFLVERRANHCQDINYAHRITRLSVLKCLHMIDEIRYALRKLNLPFAIMYSLFYYVPKPTLHHLFFLENLRHYYQLLMVSFSLQTKYGYNVRIV